MEVPNFLYVTPPEQGGESGYFSERVLFEIPPRLRYVEEDNVPLT
jgi:hypothetical protein